MLVTEPTEVSAIAEALESAPLAAFDLEFLTADRLIPVLCVVQVAWLPLDAPIDKVVAATPEIRMVDALAVDVRPLLEALAAHPCAIVHAGRQDLGIVGRFDIAMPDVVDTQIMAAFAGIGEQVGLANLASEVLGVALTKEHQWTDWSRRPLSEAQLAYAAADVRYLPAIYAKLADRLGERVAWARAESSIVAETARASAAFDPETAWQNLGGLRGLDPRGLAGAKVLAAWRMEVALELDRPLGWVLSDKSLLELARQRPAVPEGVRAVKGLAPTARQRAMAIVEALATARVDPADVEATRLRVSRHMPPRAQRWSELLLAATQLVSEQTGVAARLLATRSDADDVARAVDHGGLEAARELPAFSTWRRDVLGRVWESLLNGTRALRVDADAACGLALVPVGS